MANIPFKSITFPGLPNKYTVPEISNDLMTAGKAADAKATGDALSALEDAVTEETDKLKADLAPLDTLVADVYGQSNFELPSGYEDADYSNTAGTRLFKYENSKLHLRLGGTTVGSVSATEVTTSNASLTIGSSIAYALAGEESVKLKLSYEGNARASVVLRYYKADFSTMKTVNVVIPVGTGTITADLVEMAEAESINISTYPNVVIRALGWSAHTSTEAETVDVYVEGFSASSDGLTDKVAKLESNSASIGETVESLSIDVLSLGTDVDLITGAESTDVDKVLVVKTVSDGKVTEWTFASIDTPAPTPAQTDNVYALRQLVPSYYLAYPENPSSFDEQGYLDDIISKIPDGKSFIFITDTHWESNAKNGFKVIQYLRQKTGIKNVVFGGDCIDREDTKYLGLNIIRDFTSHAVESVGAENFIFCIGNHDANTANVITSGLDLPTYRIPYDRMYEAMISQLEGKAVFEDLSTQIASISQSDADTAELTGWSKLHYYVDDDEERTRYIVIYSSCPDNVFITSYTGFPNDGGGGPSTVMQYEWFVSTLMSTPTGYDIVVVAHCADSEAKRPPERRELRNYFDYFTRIASAFHKKCTGFKLNVALFDENACPSNAFWTRETKIWDFSNAPNVGKILFVAGHIHANAEYVSRITTDSTVNPTYEKGKARNNGDPADSETTIFDSATVDFASGEIVTIISKCDAVGQALQTMTRDTVTEQAFDIITLTDTGVDCLRVGAGWSRFVPVIWS